jgi:hypothetical protein
VTIKQLGVDPSGTGFRKYYEDANLIVEPFDHTLAQRLDSKYQVISSIAMFYDLPDPIDFISGIKDALDVDGIWISEQSYFFRMIEQNAFDTICQEHLEYYTITDIVNFCNSVGLELFDVKFNDINGGSFSITAAKASATLQPNTAWLNKILADEVALGLDTTHAFDNFKLRVEEARVALMDFLNQAKREGKRVCALGASTKGNVLLQYYGIDSNLVSAIGEVNSDKFGAFTPGTMIPLVAEDELLVTNPDYLLVLPWHFRAFFESLPKMKGRTLVFPLPKFEIVYI